MIGFLIALGVASVLALAWVWLCAWLFREEAEAPRDWRTPGLCLAVFVAGALGGAASARSWDAKAAVLKKEEPEVRGQRSEVRGQGLGKRCGKCEIDCPCGCQQGGECDCSEIVVGGWRLPCCKVCEIRYEEACAGCVKLRERLEFLCGLEGDWDCNGMSPGFLRGGGHYGLRWWQEYRAGGRRAGSPGRRWSRRGSGKR